jgi:hypothetical protein
MMVCLVIAAAGRPRDFRCQFDSDIQFAGSILAVIEPLQDAIRQSVPQA